MSLLSRIFVRPTSLFRLLPWSFVMLWGLAMGGCVKPQVVRRQARPPERRPVPPPPIKEKVNPRAAGLMTSGDYAMAQLGRWFNGKKKGSLAPTQVLPLIERAKPALHLCLTRFQRRFPGSKTTFKLRLWIGPQGRVWKSLYAGDLNADPRTLRCVRSILHRIRFLSPGGFFVWTQMIDWHKRAPKKSAKR